MNAFMQKNSSKKRWWWPSFLLVFDHHDIASRYNESCFGWARWKPGLLDARCRSLTLHQLSSHGSLMATRLTAFHHYYGKNNKKTFSEQNFNITKFVFFKTEFLLLYGETNTSAKPFFPVLYRKIWTSEKVFKEVFCE